MGYLWERICFQRHAEPLVYYVHSDHINTPRAVVDRSNYVRWRWMAEPFGTTPADESPSGLQTFTFHLRFPGQFYDEESGIHQNWHRDYIPGIGRYAQSDPIGLEGGINTYAYVEGNPLLLIDPEGLAGKGYIYKKGGVHHQLPNAVARDMNWSPAAVKEFDASGFNPPLNKKPHFKEGDLTHQQYNKDVAKFCEDWTQKNKVDPTQATPEQARQLMYDLRYNAPKSIMDFNRAIWMRSMLSNIWWYRPTE